MKKYFYLIFIILFLCSCKNSCYLTNYPTSKNFNKYKHSQSYFYLCYIDSEPQTKKISEIDTVSEIKSLTEYGDTIVEISFLKNNKNLSDFEVIVFNIKPVEMFIGEIAYEIFKNYSVDKDEKQFNRDYFLTKYNRVYFLIDKNNKADIASKKMLFKSYRNKNLVIIRRNNSSYSKSMISTQIYKLDKYTSFDHLIRIE